MVTMSLYTCGNILTTIPDAMNAHRPTRRYMLLQMSEHSKGQGLNLYV